MNDLTQALRDLQHELSNESARSAWCRGVNAYAADLVSELAEGVEYGSIDADDLVNERLIARALLNGADDWTQYSEGGCALIHGGDIAERLATDSEYDRTDGGRKAPNARESWIDVQSRALYQAAMIVVPRVLDIANDLEDDE